MKKEVVLFFLLLSICHRSYTQTCPDGQFVSAGGIDPEKGICTVCNPVCKTCPNLDSCTTYIDAVKGVTSANAVVCTSATIFGNGQIGYNSQKDVCSYCIEGCRFCIVDYNRCYQCRNGWDYDAKNYSCVRATLGLSATVLALSVLVLITLVSTCICACKL